MKKKGGRALLVLALVALFGLASCCGVGIWFGWLQPRQEIEHRKQVHADLGVPDGFTATEYSITDSTGSLKGGSYLDCLKGICPVNPAEKIHSWLTAGGVKNRTIQDMGKCLAESTAGRPTDLCLIEWTVDGCHAEAHVISGLGPTVQDRRVNVYLSIYECD